MWILITNHKLESGRERKTERERVATNHNDHGNRIMIWCSFFPRDHSLNIWLYIFFFSDINPQHVVDD